MKIAHIVFGMTMGGIEIMLADIASEQAHAGHTVGIFIINDLIDDTIIGSIDSRVAIVKIGRPLGSHNPMHLVRLNMALRCFRPDKIHLHKAKIINYLFPRFRAKTCVTQHEIMIDDDLKSIKRVPQVFAISRAVMHDIKERTGVESLLVYNGIHTGAFARREKKRSNGGPLRCVCVGRLMHEKKGQDILIKAISLLDDETRGMIHVDIIGEGESAAYLEELTESLGLEAYVEFKGLASQQWLRDNLCSYDLFIAPSIYEGFGLTIAEAMCAGVPVLVSSIDGPREVVADGVYGHMFERGNPEDCAKKIAELVSDSGLDAMVEAARNYAIANFDVTKTSKKYLQLYNET